MTNSAIITGDTAALSSALAQHIKPFAEVARGLLEMGYSPIPQQGQACRIPGWPQYAQTPIAADDIARFAGSPIPYDIGIALWYRRVVAVDRDTDDPDVVAALRPVFRCIYARGGVPVAKIGSKGATSFFRFDGDAFTSLAYRSSIAVLLELLGPGRATTLPPSLHPKTGQRYEWATRRTLLDTSVDQLPLLNALDVQAIAEALAPWLIPTKPTPIKAPRTTPRVHHDVGRRRQTQYVLAILARRCAQLETMGKDSGRNDEAFSIACRVGRWVHHGLIDEHIVMDAILAASATNHLVAEDGRASVVAAIRNGLKRTAGDELPDLGSSIAGGHRHA